MNPWFVTGFTDGEGSFLTLISKSSKVKTGWLCRVSFQIGLDAKDKALLYSIQEFFGVGIVNKAEKNMFRYRVSQPSDMRIIIEHFTNFPLLTQKKEDFNLFKEAVNILLRKEYLTREGVDKLVAIKASMNKGLTGELKALFADIIPMTKPELERGLIIDPQWLAGFISAESCFSVSIVKSQYVKQGYQVQLKFRLTQHIRDIQLMESLVSYLGGSVFKSKDAVDLHVAKLSDLTGKVLPLLEKYPIEVVKFQDYCDFIKVVELVKNKSHMTTEGLSQIRKIKAGMNTSRV